MLKTGQKLRFIQSITSKYNNLSIKFPNTPVNINIKGVEFVFSDFQIKYIAINAKMLARIKNKFIHSTFENKLNKDP